jgi:hypothetical protein
MKPWDEEIALEIGREAAKINGLGGPGEMLRLALTAVVRFDEVVIKVIKPGHREVDSLQKEWLFLQCLQEYKFPISIPLIPPIDVDGYLIMGTSYISPDPHGLLDWNKLGHSLRLLHSFPLPSFSLPSQPVRGQDTAKYLKRIKQALNNNLLTRKEADFLETILRNTTIDSLNDKKVICHGDIQSGNLITSGGILHFIDWETAQIANKIFDLSKIIGRKERYGLSKTNYNEFCRGYGEEPDSKDPRIKNLRSLSEVAGVTYLLTSPRAVQQREGYNRLKDLMSGSRRMWIDR